MPMNNKQKGFIALIAVILLATGTLAMSLVAMNSALIYSDLANKREYRIQADMNADACLDTAKLMANKDYFIAGDIDIPEFNCTATFTNDFNGNVGIIAEAKFNGVSSESDGSLSLVE